LTSPRRKRDRPIESVALKIVFRADGETTKKIKESIPSAVVRGGRCEVKITGGAPGEVAEKARGIIEKLRTAV
jgi:hypothetical protein